MVPGEATKAWKFLSSVAAELDRDAPIMQALAFTRIAMAGDIGMDQADLMDELKASTAATSRTVQALSAIHYLKDREGYGLVERLFDSSDNRKRTVKLTAAGRKAIDRILATLR